MKNTDFKQKLKLLEERAVKHKWTYHSNDVHTGRVTFQDQYSIYRVDIYVTKMTVCLLASGEQPVYLKRQDMDKVEAIFKSPEEYVN